MNLHISVKGDKETSRKRVSCTSKYCRHKICYRNRFVLLSYKCSTFFKVQQYAHAKNGNVHISFLSRM